VCDAVALTSQLDRLWPSIVGVATDLSWGDWSAWLKSLAYGRNAVLLFLPLLLVLRCLPQRHLRWGIVLTGLAFVGYVFGLLYLLLWLATCVLFRELGERYAAEVQRRDIPRWLPSAAAIAVITGHFLLVHALGEIRLPPGWEMQVRLHAGWLLPLGARGLAWEPNGFANWPLLKVLLGRTHDIGVAYFTMRMVSYFSEIRRGTLPAAQRSLLNFLAYTCYAPTLIQGPIERFREFHEQLDTCRMRRSGRDSLAALYRVALGVAKSLAITEYLDPKFASWGVAAYSNPLMYKHPEQIASYTLLLFGVHLQALEVYLTFSGYCDIAIGMSRLLGYRAIENFHRPWLARSLSDMWRRWHISLSFILRDYVFFPLTRRRWDYTLSLLVTFFICGVWHHLSGQYAAWGLLMGLLVAVNHRWARWMRNLDRHPTRRCSAIRRAWLKLQPLPKLCAWFLTINALVMAGWVCVGGWGSLRVAWELIRRPLNAVLASWGVRLQPM
jgi:D-alanyl-lipoteichoic acid acyltransferase DltB (MBOAT superfamily)